MILAVFSVESSFCRVMYCMEVSNMVLARSCSVAENLKKFAPLADKHAHNRERVPLRPDNIICNGRANLCCLFLSKDSSDSLDV